MKLVKDIEKTLKDSEKVSENFQDNYFCTH